MGYILDRSKGVSRTQERKKKQTQSYRLHCIKQLNECRHQRGSDGALLVKPTVITSTYTRTSFGNCISISIITAHETHGNKASNIEWRCFSYSALKFFSSYSATTIPKPSRKSQRQPKRR